MMCVFINSNIDLRKRAQKEYTPSEFSSGLPFQADSFARFLAGEHYLTERSGYNKFLIIYTMSGRGKLTFRGREYDLKCGDTFFIDCNEYHKYCTSKEHEWEFSWIHFRGDSVRHFYRTLFADEFYLLGSAKLIAPIFERILQLGDVFSQSDELVLSACIHELLTVMLLERFEKRQTDSVFAAVTEYISLHFPEKITIDTLAALSSYSKYHFIRLFREQMGETPYEYITRYRVNESKKLLRSTRATLSDIAARVGYGDCNTYISAFKKYVGLTPGQFRRIQN